MKKFLAVFTGTKESRAKWEQLTQEERDKREKEGMSSWGHWVATNEAHIKDHGAPLGKTKRIGVEGISDISNNLAAFTIIEAESYDAAAKLFLNHPHFTIFPGDAVEVMECLPIPGMK